MNRLFCALAVFGALMMGFIYPSEPSDEVMVILGTEHALLPTYVDSIQEDGSAFPKEYLAQLHSILSFDIGHNATNRVVEGKEREAIRKVVTTSFDDAVDIDSLRKLGLTYLVRSKMQGPTLFVKVIHVTAGTSRSISPVTCSGELSKDRKSIHNLADCIHLMLFEKPGVASTKILYVLKKGGANSSSEVYEADYDGFNSRQLTTTRSLCASPVWVPPKPSGLSGDNSEGKKSHTFFYVSYQLGQPKIYAKSLKDGKVYRVTTMRGNQLTPAISPQGSVAFCSDITGTADLYIVPFEEGVGAFGKPQQVFHAKGTATACPTFSPDGKKVAFVSNKDGSPKIYVMDIPKAGTNVKDLKPRLISTRCRENTAPAWSYDGKKIAYSAKNSGDRQIWIYDVEQSSEQQLTNSPGNKESPTWAPDSTHLIFHAYSASTCDLYLVNLNQPSPVKITSGPGEKLFAQWEPPAL